MKLENMTSPNGNKVANQFIITRKTSEHGREEVFQSYNSVIAKREYYTNALGEKITLDSHFWDYSATTGKYRNQFLGEKIAETRAKIESGEYILANLNK